MAKASHKPSRVYAVMIAGVLLAFASNTLADPGDLDPAFGTGGRMSLTLEGRQLQIDSVIQQADGKIVLAGLIGGYHFVDSTQLLLVRLNMDGTLDASFDHDGMVIGAQPNERAAVVIQQRDGKLVVAGRDTGPKNIMLWRFAADGTPDASFGATGSISFALGGADFASGLVQQSSGKLVVAGTVSGSGGTWDRDMMLARFEADGRLDATFGAGGTTVFHFARGAQEVGYALLQQPDGKLVMTGNRNVSVRNSRGGTVAVVRTTVDGGLDPSFGGGIREIFLDFHSLEGSFVHTWKQSAALLDDGRIVINGMVGADGHSSGFVFRLKREGTLDPTFDTDGIVFSGGGFLDAMASIAIQSDGKVVTAGSQDVHWSRWSQEMRLRRFMPDGRIDASFGIHGTSSADFQDMVPSLSTRAMARQADGKLIVVGDGKSLPDNRPGLAVARFVETGPDFAGLIGLLAGKTLVTANENAAELFVRRTGGSSGSVSVAYRTVDGSALAGSDYVPKVGRLEWAAGDSSPKSIPLVLIDDGKDEQEHFSLQLFDSGGGASLALQTADIWSGNVPELGFALDRATIAEDDGSITLRVSRSGSGRGSLSVDFETYSIAAQAGSDFTSAFGTLTWPDGDTTAKAIRIAILNDGASEGDEWFGVSLSNPTDGAIVGINGNVTVTVFDDDTDSPPPPAGAGQLSFLDAGTLHSVTEGSGPIRVAVYRSNGSTGQVTMDYETIAESATPGLDFSAQAATLTWADGETGIKFIDVEIVDDGALESDETFTVRLSNPTGGATIDGDHVQVAIRDNDASDDEPALALAGAAAEVGEANGSVVLTVVRSGAGFGAVSVEYATSGGTAIAGSDFAPVSGTLHWPDGDLSSKSIRVDVTNDGEDEDDETFTLTLSSPSGAVLGEHSTATVTIMDNDLLAGDGGNGGGDAGGGGGGSGGRLFVLGLLLIGHARSRTIHPVAG